MGNLSFKVSRFNLLTDIQWSLIESIVDIKAKTGRPRKANLRDVVNGLRYLACTGCQWRNIGSAYGNISVLRYYFDKWRCDGTWDLLQKTLVYLCRTEFGSNPEPTLAAIDSQSVKIVSFTKEEKGIDGNKKINGRKRHLVVDKYGLLLYIAVTAANVYDGSAGSDLLPHLKENYKELKTITADGAYKKTFELTAAELGIEVLISQKPESEKGFVPQKNRWQVERTISWLSFYRRISKDYEKKTENSVVMIQLAFISMVLNHFL